MRSADQDNGLIKALFYGLPGSTKTRTAASAVFVPEMSPVLILEQAANPLSIRKYNPQPTIISIDTMKDYNAPYDWLMKGQPEEHPFAKWLKDNNKWNEDPYKTVIIDGISETQRTVFKTVRPELDKAPGDAPPFTELRDFNAVLAMMTNWAYKYIRIPDMHVILTALEYEKQDKVGNIYRRPLLWGQSEGMIASYAYMVMRLTSADHMDIGAKGEVATEIAQVKKSQIVGFLKQTTTFYAKEQYGMDMTHMFDPTMQKIWDAVYGPSK